MSKTTSGSQMDKIHITYITFYRTAYNFRKKYLTEDQNLPSFCALLFGK